MVGGDVVRQDGQGPHAAQRALAGQGAFPVGRAADVGALRAPGVERLFLKAGVLVNGEHGLVHGAELLGSDSCFRNGVNLFVAGPDVSEPDLAPLVHAQHVVFDVKADGACNRIGHHKRR
ncbi:hypothetical protein D3C72_1384160 [compost metagenome]